MALTDLLIRGSSVAVVVFVVSSTLGVGLSLTVGQILAPLKNARLVVLSLAANFVLAPLVAVGLWRVLGLDEPLGIGLLLCGLAAGAPFLIKLAEFAKADLAFGLGSAGNRVREIDPAWATCRLRHRSEPGHVRPLRPDLSALNTHENFTGGATFVDRSDSRSSPLYRELRTDDRVQDT